MGPHPMGDFKDSRNILHGKDTSGSSLQWTSTMKWFIHEEKSFSFHKMTSFI